MSKQFDSAPTALPSGEEGEAIDGAPIVVGEVVAPQESLPAEGDTRAMEALIGEMIQRQDVALPTGTSLPLVDALETLATLIENLGSGLAVGEGAPVEATGVAAPTSLDAPLAASLETLLGKLAEEFEGISAALSGVSTPQPGAVMSEFSVDLPTEVASIPQQLAKTIRELTVQLNDPEVAAALSVELKTAASTEIPATTLEALSALPLTTVDGETVVDVDALRSVLQDLRAHVEKWVAPKEPATASLTGIPTEASEGHELLLPLDRMQQDIAMVDPEVLAHASEPRSMAASLDRVLREVFATTAPIGERTANPAVVNDLPLLDNGFALQDAGSRGTRELTLPPVIASESLKPLLAQDPRLAVLETAQVVNTGNDKAPHTAEVRPSLVTGKADVWLQQPAELPEHVMEHVNRLHAQSVRLHAAGFTDLVQRLTLSLHPEDLGQVDVQLRTGDQMNLTFFAREGATRDLLEQNLPRLRQLFESQGLSLGDVNVGSGQAQARQQAGEGREQQTNARGASPVEEGVGRSQGETRVSTAAANRLIDTRA